MNSTIKILHLEDNKNDALLVQSILKKANINFEYFLSDSEKEYQTYLETKNFDIILSDYHLPDYSGSEALLFAKNKFPHIPFVFLSGTMGEDAAIESLLNGATDYVLKNKIERLIPAIYRAFNESQAQKAKVKAEKALLQSEVNFRRSISESPLGIRIVNMDGNTIYANKAFLEIYEFSSLDEFTNTPAKERYTPESYIQHQARKLVRGNGQDVFDYELSIVRKNGEIRHVKVLRNEVLWDGVKHYQVINQDITEQKKLTIDLIAAKEKAEESNRLKSAFLANMSHEIRTPMNAIMGFSNLMSEADSDEKNAYAAIIEKSSEQLLTLIDDVILLSRLQSEKMPINSIVFSPYELVTDITLMFNHPDLKKGLDIKANISEQYKNLVIRSDAGKIRQVLTNLTSNAVKYTLEGSIEVGFNLRDKLIEFYVKDTGIGIPEQEKHRIFETFYRGEQAISSAIRGTGLGLNIAKELISLLGGSIGVNSVLRKGSYFYFTIPLEQSGTERSATSLQQPTVNDLKNLKILIADDEPVNFQYIEILLKGKAKVIDHAINGKVAVEMASKTRYDLILMDLKMPVMGGIEATEILKRQFPEIPVIAQTAYTMPDGKEIALQSGCDDIISKPIKKEELMELLNKYSQRICVN